MGNNNTIQDPSARRLPPGRSTLPSWGVTGPGEQPPTTSPESERLEAQLFLLKLRQAQAKGMSWQDDHRFNQRVEELEKTLARAQSDEQFMVGWEATMAEFTEDTERMMRDRAVEDAKKTVTAKREDAIGRNLYRELSKYMGTSFTPRVARQNISRMAEQILAGETPTSPLPAIKSFLSLNPDIYPTGGGLLPGQDYGEYEEETGETAPVLTFGSEPDPEFGAPPTPAPTAAQQVTADAAAAAATGVAEIPIDPQFTADEGLDDLWDRAAEAYLNEKSRNYRQETDQGKKDEMVRTWVDNAQNAYLTHGGHPFGQNPEEVEAFIMARYLGDELRASDDDELLATASKYIDSSHEDYEEAVGFMVDVSSDVDEAMKATPGWVQRYDPTKPLDAGFVYRQLEFNYMNKYGLSSPSDLDADTVDFLTDTASKIVEDVEFAIAKDGNIDYSDPDWYETLDLPAMYDMAAKRIGEFDNLSVGEIDEEKTGFLRGDEAPKTDEIYNRLSATLSRTHPEMDLTSPEAQSYLTRKANEIIRVSDQLAKNKSIDGKPNWAIAFANVDTMIADIAEQDVETINEDMDKRSLTQVVQEWISAGGHSPPNEASLLGSDSVQDFIKAWKLDDDAVARGLSLDDWLIENGTDKVPEVLQSAQDRVSGVMNAATAQQMYLRAAKDAGLLPDDYTPAQLKSVLDGFNTFYHAFEIGKATDPLLDFKGMMTESVAELPAPTEVTRRQRSRFGQIPPGYDPNMAMNEAVDRLEDRVGAPTLGDDLRKKREDLAAIEADLDDETLMDSDPEYYQSQLEASKDMAAEIETMEGQAAQQELDVKMGQLLMDIPELSRAFASGDTTAIQQVMGEYSEDEIPAAMRDHVASAQQRQGLVMTPQQQAFRQSMGIPTAYIPQTRAQIAEQGREREIGLARQASRTTRYTAEGEEIKFDPTRGTYDVRAGIRYDAQGGVVGVGGEGMIPGTNLPDTPENRASLAGGMAPEGRGQQVAPGANVVPPPPQMLGYYREDEDEDEDEDETANGGGTV